MKKPNVTKKTLHLDKEQTRVSVTVAIAVIISVFCLTATKVLISNGSYKRQVINARHDAAKQMKNNIAQAQQLISQFQVFEGDNPTNIIGGKNTRSTSVAPPDGNNSRIVLDALPSSYDFPALISSMAKILSDDGINNPALSGSDQSSATDSSPTATPQPLAIPLSLSGVTTYKGTQRLVRDLERSIRPFDITNLSIQGTPSNISFTAIANTYFQPSKTLSVSYKEIK